MEVSIAGWREISLVDVIGSVSFTVWFSYCNFRCPWCSNFKLASGIESKKVKIAEIMEALKKASSFIDYFHITGGEPTLQPRPLLELIKEAKLTGLATSLDTNGSNPEVLDKLIPLLDRIAIDVKAPLSDVKKYSLVTGLSISGIYRVVSNVKRSISLAFKVPLLELRTTVVPGMIHLTDLLRIAKDLNEIISKSKGEVIYVIQQFIPYEGVRDPRFRGSTRTPPELLKEYAKEVAKVLPIRVLTRSIEEGVKVIGGPARIRTGDHHLS